MAEYELQQSPIVNPRRPATTNVENIWTPEITFTTPGDLSVAYSDQAGVSICIGTLVYVRFKLTTSTFTHTTASGDLKITGLPYTPAGGSKFLDSIVAGPGSEAIARAGAFAGGGNVHFSGITKANYTHAYLNPVYNQTYMSLILSGSGQARDAIGPADMPTGGSVVIGGYAFFARTLTAS